METNDKTAFGEFIDRLIDYISENKTRILIIFAIYISIIFAACALGVFLSFGAQPGGITQVNAFIAPLIGPWSQVLEPNSHHVGSWSERYKMFAIILTVILVICLTGSLLFMNFWLSYMSTVIAFLSLIIWVLSGLAKVVSQLS